MVLVVREDLGMSRGKVAAQCAHAALGGGAARRRVRHRAVGRGRRHDDRRRRAARGLSALRDAASNAGLPPPPRRRRRYKLKWSRARSTVLAVGPGEVSRVDAITGRLPLLR